MAIKKYISRALENRKNLRVIPSIRR